MALLLVGVAAILSWSYVQQKLQRKQQVAVVGGLKDMDDTTLKKVLGEVGTTFIPLAAAQCSESNDKVSLLYTPGARQCMWC